MRFRPPDHPSRRAWLTLTGCSNGIPPDHPQRQSFRTCRRQRRNWQPASSRIRGGLCPNQDGLSVKDHRYFDCGPLRERPVNHRFLARGAINRRVLKCHPPSIGLTFRNMVSRDEDPQPVRQEQPRARISRPPRSLGAAHIDLHGTGTSHVQARGNGGVPDLRRSRWQVARPPIRTISSSPQCALPARRIVKSGRFAMTRTARTLGHTAEARQLHPSRQHDAPDWPHRNLPLRHLP